MQVLRVLLLSLIAAIFAVSGAARAMPMPTAAAEPPCHEAPAQHDKSKPAQQAAVNCCVGCMPAPNLTATAQVVAPAERAAYAPISITRTGRLTAPEPDPPRLRA